MDVPRLEDQTKDLSVLLLMEVLQYLATKTVTRLLLLRLEKYKTNFKHL